MKLPLFNKNSERKLVAKLSTDSSTRPQSLFSKKTERFSGYRFSQ